MAVYGTMLYPKNVASDREKARDFADFQLKSALQDFENEGNTVPEDLVDHLNSDVEKPRDVAKRELRGRIAGEIFTVAFELALNDPGKASWQSAYRVVSEARKKLGVKTAGERSLREIRDQFLPASHLWAALNFRERGVSGDESTGYSAMTDFHNFLFESEILRHSGRNWVHSRDKAAPLLPGDLWHVPYDWTPPDHEPNWPSEVGKIAHYEIDAVYKEHLKPRGRPAKSVQIS